MDTLATAVLWPTGSPVAFKAASADRLDAYDLALRALERDYPVLDPDSHAFDEDVMLGVYEWMQSLVRQGADPVSALTSATFDSLGQNGRIERVTAGALGLDPRSGDFG